MVIFSDAITECVCVLRLGDGGHVIYTFGKVHGFPAHYWATQIGLSWS